jgi:hypothetical protein
MGWRGTGPIVGAIDIDDGPNAGPALSQTGTDIHATIAANQELGSP